MADGLGRKGDCVYIYIAALGEVPLFTIERCTIGGLSSSLSRLLFIVSLHFFPLTEMETNAERMTSSS